jgi:DNA-binding transcriptional LysR family regulator
VLDPWALRIVVTVADCGSFSAAAEQLVLTQPAVSRQVAGLERQLGVALFRRHPRGVSPTEAGRTALPLARAVLSNLETLEATVKAFGGLDGGALRVAGFSSVNTHFLPSAVRRFDAAHPAVAITLVSVDPFDALVAVREGRVEVAIVTDWQLAADPVSARTDAAATMRDPHDIDGLELRPLLDEDFCVALPKGHPLARKRLVPLADLRTERWVDGAFPDCLGPLPQLGRALGALPQIRFVCDDWNGKQALVAGGSGVMVVPTLAVEGIRDDIALRPTTPRLPTRRLYAASLRPPLRTPATEALLAMLADLAADVRPRRKGGR